MKILVSPLNWGLGHASRCIPIIKELISLNYEVHIVAEELPLLLLKKEFPNLTFCSIPSHSVVYSSSGSQTLKVLRALPKVLWSIKKEREQFQELHKEQCYSGIISDNRPGAYINGIPSVYMTHQTKLHVGLFSKVADVLHRQLFREFTEVWIPDNKANPIAGSLSQSKMNKAKYIGWLSRAKKLNADIKYDSAIILSGPEPQRSLFEELILEQINQIEGNFILVRGSNLQCKTTPKSHIQVIDVADSQELDKIVSQSKLVIARTGYSTLMDLQVWQKPAVLVPTPGQPEQEYLGMHLSENYGMLVRSQEEFQFVNDISSAKALLIKSAKQDWENFFKLFN